MQKTCAEIAATLQPTIRDAIEELKAERHIVKNRLDIAMEALQSYSKIKGVRRSDMALAAYGPGKLKKRLNSLDAKIADLECTERGTNP